MKLTIIILSMVTVMTGTAISPGLSLIANAFPDTNPTLIKLLLTIPSLTIIPVSFLSGYLTTKFRKRTIILFGLIIYIIGGVGAQFVSTIELLLGFRLLLGVGVGLVMPLSISLINDFYTGKERTKMMGYNSAFGNFSGIITMIFAGWLATFGWRIPFNVYFMGLAILFMVVLFIPKGDLQKAVQKEHKWRTPRAVYGYALAAGGIMAAYYAIAINMALYLEQNNFGGSALAGTVISFTTIGGMITGLALFWLQKTFKKFVIPIMLFGMGSAFLVLSLTNNIILVIISVCFIGFGQGSLYPLIILKGMDHVAPNQGERAVAYISSFAFFGQFLCPIILDGIGSIAKNPSIRFQFGALAIIIIISVAINLLFLFRTGRQMKLPEKQLIG